MLRLRFKWSVISAIFKYLNCQKLEDWNTIVHNMRQTGLLTNIYVRMKVAITGVTGFIGSYLESYFEEKGHKVIPILRRDFEEDNLKNLIAGTDVVINLAGAPIAKRWTTAYKKELETSRIETVRKVVKAIGDLRKKSRPEVFISASAIGIYDSERENDEFNFRYGDDLLAKICLKWEDEANKAGLYDVRVIIARFGLVLGKKGGMFPRMLKVFRLGLGGKIASGKQGFSYIHIHDLIRAMMFVIKNKDASGVYNFVVPNPVNNEVFTRHLASLLHKPSYFTVPEIALRMVFSEAASAFTSGSVVYPKRLVDSGFKFSYPELHSALSDLIDK